MTSPNRAAPPIEVSSAELRAWLDEKPDLILLDIRQDDERILARLKDPRERHAPMSEIVRLRQHALPDEMIDRDRPTVVFCHVGVRSLQVVSWLRQLGWTQVFSLAGGIDAYARECDPTVGRY